MNDYRLYRETMTDTKFREDAEKNGKKPFYFGIFPKGDVRMEEGAVAAEDEGEAKDLINKRLFFFFFFCVTSSNVFVRSSFKLNSTIFFRVFIISSGK